VWVDDRDRPGAKHQVYAAIQQSVGVPLGERCALQFPVGEMNRLVTLMFARLVFGWSVPDDLFVIPDHGRQIVQTDHHDVAHVWFLDASDVGTIVQHMAGRNYSLPDELPDATFKRPAWME
jgi:hypothetical protein